MHTYCSLRQTSCLDRYPIDFQWLDVDYNPEYSTPNKKLKTVNKEIENLRIC